MAESAMLQTDRISKALETFVKTGQGLLQNAKRESKEGSTHDFVTKKIRIERRDSLLGLIAAGAELYKSLSVKKKSEAEKVWKNAYHCAQVRDAVEAFLQLETDWDTFLEHLDAELRMTDLTLHRGTPMGQLSAETPLIDARTGEAVTLGNYLRKGERILLVLIRQFACLLCRIHVGELEANQGMLDAQSVRVLVISFGSQEGAQYWLQDTDCKYDMLLDPERKIYSWFGLGTSVTKVLSFENMLLYSEYIISNHTFPQAPAFIKDDMFQLGGDFVLDEDGRVIFSHCCKSPVDRPVVSEMLTSITKGNPTTGS
ncbi:hypothetical protein AGOR_G00108980 [Albula goreensis]|uniref:Uncharacterized protein n=1 Tax=Albula goreensis TaxID=1534307 RepID=A0A8T3DIM8_9TELE|nr:hypothetical protein AGOR_G00108980 [Albula goreensis]